MGLERIPQSRAGGVILPMAQFQPLAASAAILNLHGIQRIRTAGIAREEADRQRPTRPPAARAAA